MTIEVLNPTHEANPTEFRLAERLPSLDGATVGVISNGKEGTKPFFDALESILIEDHGVAQVIRMTKRNYSAPAEPELMAKAADCDALIAGVGD